MREVADDRIPWVKMILVAVGGAMVALIAFPAFAYASFFTYGIPAALLFGSAYFVWLVLSQKNRMIPNAFAGGFLSVVVIFIVLIFRAKPLFGMLVVWPLLAVSIFHWRIGSRLP
jgi:uncharacterized membrane protein HdeD (DUF308 family)